MEIQELETNSKVSLLREIAVSFGEKKVSIPENEQGFIEGNHKIQELIYFLADMIEE